MSSCAETDQLAVGTVTSLQVQEPHGEVIRVSWVGVQGATAYRVSWRRVDGRTLGHAPAWRGFKHLIESIQTQTLKAQLWFFCIRF